MSALAMFPAASKSTQSLPASTSRRLRRWRPVLPLAGLVIALAMTPQVGAQCTPPPPNFYAVGDTVPGVGGVVFGVPDANGIPVAPADPASVGAVLAGFPINYTGTPYYVPQPPKGQSANYSLYGSDGTFLYAVSVITDSSGNVSAAAVDTNLNVISAFTPGAGQNTTTTSGNTTVTTNPGPPKTITVVTDNGDGTTTTISVTQTQGGDGSWTGLGFVSEPAPSKWFWRQYLIFSGDGTLIYKGTLQYDLSSMP